MNAKEARKKTEENIISSSNAMRCEIDGKINAAIKDKKFQIIIYKYIRQEERSAIEDYYKSMGYTWKTHLSHGFNDEPSITISW